MGISIRIEFHLHVSRTERKDTPSEQQPATAQTGMGFLAEANSLVERLKPTLSPSTIGNYSTALRSLKAYLGRDIAVGQLDQQTFKGFERWLLDKQVCLNTVSCYMRSLRSLLRRLCGAEGSKAFGSVYTGRAKTEKRAVGEADIASLKAVRLKASSFACLVRDLFLFSFYALGMPFVDLAFLRKSQIRDGQLVYQRHKTGQRIVVRLEPCMTEIINRYQTDDTDYVFPLIRSADADKAYREYQQKLGAYNRALKQLAKEAGIESRLTSYTPRHTWASIAFCHNVDLPVISKGLGHANPHTTLTYIRQINDNRLEEANRSILQNI